MSHQFDTDVDQFIERQSLASVTGRAAVNRMFALLKTDRRERWWKNLPVKDRSVLLRAAGLDQKIAPHFEWSRLSVNQQQSVSEAARRAADWARGL